MHRSPRVVSPLPLNHPFHEAPWTVTSTMLCHGKRPPVARSLWTFLASNDLLRTELQQRLFGYSPETYTSCERKANLSRPPQSLEQPAVPLMISPCLERSKQIRLAHSRSRRLHLNQANLQHRHHPLDVDRRRRLRCQISWIR